MAKVLFVTVLSKSIFDLADEFDGPAAQSFFDNYNRRDHRKSAQDDFWEFMQHWGFLDKDEDYILSFKEIYPYINLTINMDIFQQRCHEVIEKYKESCTSLEIEFLDELF